jgi:site-specific recombinase XerD
MNITKLTSGIYQAELRIPADVQHVIGKMRFAKSTRTRDRREAAVRAAEWLAGWQRQIDLARENPDALADEIAVLTARAKVERERGDFADERSGYTHADAALERYQDFDWLESLPPSKAKQYANIMWKGVPLPAFMERFIAAQYPRYRAQMEARRYILEATLHCPTLEAISQEAARSWIRSEAQKPEETRRSVATMMKATGYLSEYVLWLKDQRLLSDNVVNPFKRVRYPKALRKKEKYVPLSLDEVLAVREAAHAKGDAELVAFIDVARFTGMRLAEIAALSSRSVETVDGVMCFRVKLDAKTEKSAGRLVPIAEGLKRLLPLHSFDLKRRDNCVGKRFSNIKRAVLVDGASRTKCFHSLRKFVVTELERGKVSEGVTADLVGHEKKTITYGVYSGGSALRDLAKAVAVLDTVQPVGGDDPSNVVRLRG